MNSFPSMTPNERTVMDIIWQQEKSSTASILSELEGIDSWSRHTIKTYLIRLVDKGMIERIDISARKVNFVPLITKEEYLAGDASQYLSTNFKGLTHMVSGLVDNEMISEEELDNLEKFITQLKKSK